MSESVRTVHFSKIGYNQHIMATDLHYKSGKGFRAFQLDALII